VSTCLVAGGAGFLGSWLATHLIDQGHNVVVLDDLSGGYLSNVDPRANFYRASTCDSYKVNSLFDQCRFDYVFNLAAFAAEGLSHFIRRFSYENNLTGSINLINAAIKHEVKCFVFTSSMAVYGTNQVPFTEDMKPAPEDPYGIAKYAVEQDLKVAKAMFGMEYVIFRPHSVIGPKQNIADPYRNVAGIFCNQLLTGKPMTIFGDGEQMRAFSYVGDMVPIIAEAPFTPAAYGKTFNIGGETPITINQLATLVASSLGVERNVIHLEPRHEVKIAYSDHAALWSVFGRRSLTSIEDGLQRMADWAKEKGPMTPTKFPGAYGIEIEKNLPSFWRNLSEYH
jgi:UDP-glucose 4-epimerase